MRAVGRMKTFEHEGGYALHTFYIIFFGLSSPACYHEILRPVGLRKQATPIKGVGYSPSLHPRNPSRISFVKDYHYHYIYAYKISGRPPSPDAPAMARVVSPAFGFFIGVYYETNYKRYKKSAQDC